MKTQALPRPLITSSGFDDQMGHGAISVVKSFGDHALSYKNRAEILVVEDESDFLEMLGSALHEYDVVTAQNGQEALAIFQQRSPDLVLTDIVMPKLDGVQLITEIAKYKTPIVAFSGYAMDESSFGWYMVQESAVKFFEKPFMLDQFVAYVDEVLKKS